MNHIRRQLSETHGQTMTEYAVIMALVVSLSLTVLPTFGASVLNLFDQIAAVVGAS
jgi:Flp pilus assembly pilin Flp